MNRYNLDFISDEDIYSHVKKTVDLYRFDINFKKFNDNLIDQGKRT